MGESPPTFASDRAGTSASVASVSGNVAAPMRIGILGAARIPPLALINPAKENVDVVVAAVGAPPVPGRFGRHARQRVQQYVHPDGMR